MTDYGAIPDGSIEAEAKKEYICLGMNVRFSCVIIFNPTVLCTSTTRRKHICLFYFCIRSIHCLLRCSPFLLLSFFIHRQKSVGLSCSLFNSSSPLAQSSMLLTLQPQVAVNFFHPTSCFYWSKCTASGQQPAFPCYVAAAHQKLC